MHLQPIQRADRMLIQGYGKGGFRISDTQHDGSVIVLADQVLRWGLASMDHVTEDSFDPLLETGFVPEVVLLGCGSRMTLVPSALRKALRDKGLVIDPMDTGAACRTYNLLLSEDRKVAACLIAV